jgi:hypothetical protein
MMKPQLVIFKPGESGVRGTGTFNAPIQSMVAALEDFMKAVVLRPDPISPMFNERSTAKRTSIFPEVLFHLLYA